MLHFLNIAWFSGLPETIGKLENLQSLDLQRCEKLEGSRCQLSFVLPMLHSLKITRSLGLPDTIGDLKNLQDLNLKYCGKLKGRHHQLSIVVPVLHFLNIAWFSSFAKNHMIFRLAGHHWWPQKSSKFEFVLLPKIGRWSWPALKV